MYKSYGTTGPCNALNGNMKSLKSRVILLDHAQQREQRTTRKDSLCAMIRWFIQITLLLSCGTAFERKTAGAGARLCTSCFYTMPLTGLEFRSAPTSSSQRTRLIQRESRAAQVPCQCARKPYRNCAHASRSCHRVRRADGWVLSQEQQSVAPFRCTRQILTYESSGYFSRLQTMALQGHYFLRRLLWWKRQQFYIKSILYYFLMDFTQGYILYLKTVSCEAPSQECQLFLNSRSHNFDPIESFKLR